jgi:hypothetical protein
MEKKIPSVVISPHLTKVSVKVDIDGNEIATTKITNNEDESILRE